jgi:hypothetical protein
VPQSGAAPGKKRKKSASGASSPLKPAAAKTVHPRRLADVGSVQLATSSPPIVRR